MSYDAIPADVEPRDCDVVRFAKWQDTRSPAAKCLDKAKEMIDGDRNAQHGNRHDCLGGTAIMWDAWNRVRKPGPERKEDVAVRNVLQKLVRTQTGNGNGDNWDDAAGYIGLGAEVSDHGC